MRYTWSILWLSIALHLGQVIHADNNNTQHNRRYRSLRHRIVGGKSAQFSRFHSAACLVLRHNWGNDFRGGATIIAQHWAVTAAHCMMFINETHIKRRSAFVHSNSKYWDKHYRSHRITKSYVHELYNDILTDFDIALVKVKEPFDGKYEKPIKFAPSNFIYVDNKVATVVGWGTTDAISEPFVVDDLRQVDIKLINPKICSKRFRLQRSVITDKMVCAFEPGKDACINDSGGPLYQDNVLIGIVSWGGPECADPVLPGVYTKISPFNKWIHNIVRADNANQRRNDDSQEC